MENKAFLTNAECYALVDPHMKTADGRYLILSNYKLTCIEQFYIIMYNYQVTSELN